MDHLPIALRIERQRRFYAMNNTEGPILGFFLAPYYPLHRYQGAATIPSGVYRPEDLVVSSFLADYERLHARYGELEGDCIWTASAFWGVPWVEAAAGCVVVADHETGSSRTRPPEKPVNPANADLAFDPADPWVLKIREFVAAIARQSAGRYPLGTTLMRGIADVLSAIHGTPDFVYRLIDSPVEQELRSKDIAGLWIGLAKAQLEMIPEFHGGVGSYFYNLWMPGRGVWIQEDAAALLSPQLFERCLWPAIRMIIDSFDSTIIHLHPSRFLPLDLLLDSPVLAVELHRDYAGPSVEDLLPVYRKIQERKPLIIWGDLKDAELEVIQRKLDPRSLALLPVVRDRDRAQAICQRLGR
jgi:hypothetical protein